MGKQYPQSIVKKTETTCVWESRQWGALWEKHNAKVKPLSSICEWW
jgi:hypothetical protein